MSIPMHLVQEGGSAPKRSLVGRFIDAVKQVCVLAFYALVIVILAGWVWFVFWGSKPAVIIRVPTSGSEESFCRFIGPHRVLFVGNDRVAVFDTAKKEQIWSKPFPGVSQVETSGKLLWLVSEGTLFALHPESGAEQAITPIEIPIESISLVGDTLLVMIDQLVVLDAGRLVAEYPIAPAMTCPVGGDPQDSGAQAAAGLDPEIVALGGAALAEFRSDFGADEGYAFRREYIQGVKIEVELIKANMVEKQAMKPFDDSLLKGSLGVGDAMAMATHLANEQRRGDTGGVEVVDESIYRVKLDRLTDKAAVPWTGDVVGPPRFFPLASVDLLVAGHTLIVLDKQGKKLWESPLTYPIAKDLDRGIPPAVETPGGLYFFDQGVLTSFELNTGIVRWRLGSVGISQLQFDSAGMLYVSSTNASPESIRYSQQVDFTKRGTESLLMKVDPVSGKILWQVEKEGDRCYASGKFVYFTRTQATGDGAHFRIFRVDPKTGKSLWEHYSPEKPLAIDFRDNQILVLFPERLEVLKFFSL